MYCRIFQDNKGSMTLSGTVTIGSRSGEYKLIVRGFVPEVTELLRIYLTESVRISLTELLQNHVTELLQNSLSELTGLT
ncbi:MAG: hypothetical protein WA125_15635 [Desulfosporosinus sp.]